MTAMRMARAAYLVVLALVLGWVLVANRDQVADLLRVDRPWLLGLALVASFGQLALSAAFWVRALAAMGQPSDWWTVLGVTARSIPARYVPGSVWYPASRAGMLRSTGVGMRALGATALLESVLTVIVSLSVGAVILGLAGRLPGDRLASVAWTLALAVLVSPPVLNRLLAWMSRRRDDPRPPAPSPSSCDPRPPARWHSPSPSTTGGAPQLSWRDYRALVVWMVAFWLLSAVTFTLYLLAFDLELPGPLVIAGVFLVAWAIGFLTPIAPQGAGAFELVFVTLLVGTASGALAVVVAAFRALIGVRDAVAFAWGAWQGRAQVSAPDGDPAPPACR